MTNKPKYFYLPECNAIFKLCNDNYYIYGVIDRSWFPYNISSMPDLGYSEIIELTEEELFLELL